MLTHGVWEIPHQRKYTPPTPPPPRKKFLRTPLDEFLESIFICLNPSITCGQGSDSEDDSYVEWDDSLNTSSTGLGQPFLEEGPRDNGLPLIPVDFGSPQEALENFVRVFESR